jgi:hypothetical protein
VLRPRGARAPAAGRRIGREHDRAEAGGGGAIHERFDFAAVWPIVKLEPLRRAAPLGGDVFDCPIGVARHDVRRACFRGAARGGAFAFRIEQFVAPHRGNHDRMRLPVAQQGHAGVDRRNVVQHTRPQPQRPPSRDVLNRADFVIGAGGTEGKRSRRHFLPRLTLQRIEIDTIHGTSSGTMVRCGACPSRHRTASSGRLS